MGRLSSPARSSMHGVTAGLTQLQLARRAWIRRKSVIACLESGRTRPSTQTLERLAAATGTRLRITFESVAFSPR